MVTGGGARIGRAVAACADPRRARGDGARPRDPALEETVAAGSGGRWVSVDVTDEAALAAAPRRDRRGHPRQQCRHRRQRALRQIGPRALSPADGGELRERDHRDARRAAGHDRPRLRPRHLDRLDRGPEGLPLRHRLLRLQACRGRPDPGAGAGGGQDAASRSTRSAPAMSTPTSSTTARRASRRRPDGRRRRSPPTSTSTIRKDG